MPTRPQTSTFHQYAICCHKGDNVVPVRNDDISTGGGITLLPPAVKTLQQYALLRLLPNREQPYIVRHTQSTQNDS